MTFKNFVDKANKGQLTSADVEGIADIRVPSAEGYVHPVGGHAVPSYLSTIQVTDPQHRGAVERALRSAGL
jgi:hypothetical protein